MVEIMTPVLLAIRDGWGVNNVPELAPFNAIAQADTPFCDHLSAEWPRTELAAHGPDVGVPPGIMGNSEVGHQNIGAGRIVDQEIMRINKGLEDLGAMLENPALKKAFDRAKSGSGKLHLMGLVSDAGVHAMIEHLYKLLEIAWMAEIEEVYIHAFTDGRDTAPTSGLGYIKDLEAKCKEIGIGQIASVCGRFWVMDRDKRWDRVERAYNMLTGKDAPIAISAEAAIQGYYDAPAGESMKGDEFVPPTWIADESGEPRATFSDGDSVVFFNFRGDRPREITAALITDDFDGFDRGEKLDLVYATMTDYQKGLCPDIVFPKPPKMPNILGSFLADKGIRQFRCAETEKYPHVTFFFNDYRDESFSKEERQVLPSPGVSTYDEAPEMSAQGVMDAAEEAILSERFGLIVVNFANPDMVGHTGSIPACVRACEIVDRGVEKLCKAIDKIGGVAVVTADHGNCDQMGFPDSDAIHTSHTLNPVELVLYGAAVKEKTLFQEDNRLADIAPTILDLMKIEKPVEMTGKSLIV
ncbi:MAG: 2,3-bisphosphoglycerate-independent phosphoglycerate mutase [Opitutales bacterium]|nr:2,3-bisphosphoglycerate-independent phosphoglycerate mutase [Opitutales bacterium]